jgi:hypothetical protein
MDVLITLHSLELQWRVCMILALLKSELSMAYREFMGIISAYRTGLYY